MQLKQASFYSILMDLAINITNANKKKSKFFFDKTRPWTIDSPVVFLKNMPKKTSHEMDIAGKPI